MACRTESTDNNFNNDHSNLIYNHNCYKILSCNTVTAIFSLEAVKHGTSSVVVMEVSGSL